MNLNYHNKNYQVNIRNESKDAPGNNFRNESTEEMFDILISDIGDVVCKMPESKN